MSKKWSILLALLLPVTCLYAQVNPNDTTRRNLKDIDVIDTTLNYEELFQDFDAFMDSILSPHSYFLASVSFSNGYFNFEQKTGYVVETQKKLAYSPTLGFYHKGGLGFTATAYGLDDGSNINFYQGALTPSFDYLQNRRFATGLSYTKYITKKDLSFYTSPLQNEIYAYFTYRKFWLKPMVAMSYGWGSRTDYQERESLIQDIRLRRRGFTYINTEETISDFSLLTSVRHDFYWLDVFTFKDHIRFTPQLVFTSGTQKFGFNQTASTYGTLIRNNSNVLFSSENIYLDDELKFQPLSLSMFLRGEYSLGKFFIQPQFAMDYYFPAETNNFNTMFTVNIGVLF